MQLITVDTPISDNQHQVMLMVSSSICRYFSINKRHGTIFLVYVSKSRATFCLHNCCSTLLDLVFLCRILTEISQKWLSNNNCRPACEFSLNSKFFNSSVEGGVSEGFQRVLDPANQDHWFLGYFCLIQTCETSNIRISFSGSPMFPIYSELKYSVVFPLFYLW